MRLAEYKTLIFDCDGVVLNSNKVKTEAFYKVALPYGEAAAQQLVDYHIMNGGISRYKKFEYFLNSLLPKDVARPTLLELTSAYAENVFDGLMTCEIADGLAKLRKATGFSRWLVVSGGDQQELVKVFSLRGLLPYFDGGVFGSPDNKDDILKREMNMGNIQGLAVFLGDSQYDFEAARRAGLDFMFISGWSEWKASFRYEPFFTASYTKLADMY